MVFSDPRSTHELRGNHVAGPVYRLTRVTTPTVAPLEKAPAQTRLR
jgi:hypothetical protein